MIKNSLSFVWKNISIRHNYLQEINHVALETAAT